MLCSCPESRTVSAIPQYALGRPMRYGAHIAPVSCSLPRTWISALDNEARERNMARVELLRAIIGRWLAEEEHASAIISGAVAPATGD